jgi:hypothetical protein
MDQYPYRAVAIFQAITNTPLSPTFNHKENYKLRSITTFNDTFNNITTLFLPAYYVYRGLVEKTYNHN